MLGTSDTPFERLEHRRHEYSGKCTNASVYDYLRQHLIDEKKKKRSYQRLCPANTASAHTVSIIMLHLIIVIKRTAFTSLKHNCLFLHTL